MTKIVIRADKAATWIVARDRERHCERVEDKTGQRPDESTKQPAETSERKRERESSVVIVYHPQDLTHYVRTLTFFKTFGSE